MRVRRSLLWLLAPLVAVVFSLFVSSVALLLVHSVAAAIVYFVVAALAYTPISYYTDLWLYRRNQRAKRGGARDRTGAK